jgi:hypothetical protein
MSYNSLNAKNDKTPFAQMYPGDAYLDEVCVSAYMFCGKSVWHTTVQPIQAIIGEWYNEIVGITNKPLCIAEMSSTANCGGKSVWITATWNALALQYTRIKTINWFFLNTPSLKEDLDLNSQQEIAAWRDGLQSFKRLTGNNAQGDAMDISDAQEVAALKAREKYEKELKERGLFLSIDGGKPF